MTVNEKLSFGVFLPQGWRLDLPPELSPEAQWRLIVDIAHRIEKLRFDGLWVYDHFDTFPTKERRSVFEAWTTLIGLSQVTQRVRLGQLVTCYAYRNPAVLAKMASCLDTISNGRLEFGIGAGWYEEEFNAYGIPYPKFLSRVGGLGEVLQIIIKMWTEDRTDFDGKYFKLKDALNYPKPVQKPHPPITVGGGSNETLKLVSRYADKWNIDLSFSQEASKEKLKVLRDHCRNNGRDFDDIGISVHKDVVVARTSKEAEDVLRRAYGGVEQWFESHNLPALTYDKFLERSFHGTPTECMLQMKQFVDIGVSQFILYVHNLVDTTPLELIAQEIVPELTKQ
jgi:F420-dependent oxidoreductase-like protein